MTQVTKIFTIFLVLQAPGGLIDVLYFCPSPLSLPPLCCIAVERVDALKEKHDEQEMIKSIILGDNAASQKAMVAYGGNNIITDGNSMIKEKPPSAMMNTGHTKGFFGDITRSLRNSYSMGTLHSSSKSRVFVGQQAMIEEESHLVKDDVDVHPGTQITIKPQNNNDKVLSGKSLNGGNSSGKMHTSGGDLNTSGKSVAATSRYHQIDDTAAHALASHFADAVLHDESLSFADHYDGEHHVNLYDSFSWRTMMILLENHYMTHFWIGGPSLSKSRCLRYLVRNIQTSVIGFCINKFLSLILFYLSLIILCRKLVEIL